MNDRAANSPRHPEDIAAAAATWVMRLDRGLSPGEQDEYLQWLAADPRHGEAMATYGHTWEAFDRLAGLQSSLEAVPDPDLLRPRRRGAAGVVAGLAGAGLSVAKPTAGSPGAPTRATSGRRMAWFAAPLAAAAALAIFFWPRPLAPVVSHAPAIAAASVQLAPIEERTLADGTTLRLNRGAAVAVEYSAAERRVRLERGEATFEVTKDPVRPFIVMAAGVAVRAVGTAFNVKLDSTAVEVLVTEGMVAVATEDRRWTTDDGGQRAEVSGQKSEVSGDGTGERKRAADEKGGLAVAPVVSASGFRPLTSDLRPLTSGVFVSAGQRAVVPLEAAGGPPKVSTPPPEEVARRLAWQPRLLTFTDEPLSEILAAFNRHNPVALRLDDPALAELRLSVRFRSDNVPGFLRLLESEFRVRAQQQSAGEIVLRAAQ